MEVNGNRKVKKLKKIRTKITALRRQAVAFDEEVRLNAVLFAVDRAIKMYEELGYGNDG